MAKDQLEPLLTFPFEIVLHQRLFEQQPLRIAELFAQCFDSQGVQRFQVSTHVLEALAERFRRVLDGESLTLDEAFGGKIRRETRLSRTGSIIRSLGITGRLGKGPRGFRTLSAAKLPSRPRTRRWQPSTEPARKT